LVACPDGKALVRRIPKSGFESSITTEGRARLKIGFRTLELSWSPAAIVSARISTPTTPRRPRVRTSAPRSTKIGILRGPGSVRKRMTASSHGWWRPRWTARKIAWSHAIHTGTGA